MTLTPDTKLHPTVPAVSPVGAGYALRGAMVQRRSAVTDAQSPTGLHLSLRVRVTSVQLQVMSESPQLALLQS